MSTHARVLGAFLVVLTITCFPGISQCQDPPLTTFRPNKDFFQVANTGTQERGYSGACLGIAESAIARWQAFDRNPTQTVRLADLGNQIISSRPNGKEFLKEVNDFAQNHSYSSAAKPARSGDRVAAVILHELQRTNQPQTLALNLPDGKRHAVVIWDGNVTDDKIVFRVGDPNHPDRNDLYLSYDSTLKDWNALQFPKDSLVGQATGKFAPCIVRWDETNKRPADIPKKEKFGELFAEVENAVKNTKITAHSIGNKLQLLVPLRRYDLKTIPLDDAASQTRDHKIVGTWATAVKYNPETWTFERGGRFISDSSIAGVGSWASTGDNSVTATISYSHAVATITTTYKITIRDGKANVEFKHSGRIRPDSGSFTIQKQK